MFPQIDPVSKNLFLVDAEFARESTAVVERLDVGGDVAAVRELLLAKLAGKLASAMDGGLVSFEGGCVGEVFVAFGAGKSPTTMNRLHVKLQ